MFFCAISGEAPQDPVVSSKSGHVYERRLILKYLNENGTDPVTGEKIEETDLVSIKASPKTAAPRPPAQTSIPALLHTLQNEWDALVLETFTLKQQYNNTRQELSYALYAQDAASRVVARLLKERDAAREALSTVSASIGVAAPAAANGDVEMTDGQEDVLPKEVLTAIDETHKRLSSTRKKRKAPDGYVTADALKSFGSKHTIPSLHSASPAGITSIAISSSNPSQFVTGGNDKIVQVYDRSTDKVLATLKSHTKKVNHVALREADGSPTLVLSGGADKLAKIWSHDSASGDYKASSTIRTHKGEITGLSVHPSSILLGLSSLDKTYSLHDLNTFKLIYQSAPAEQSLTSLGIHPDGTLIAVGTNNSTIQIHDIRTGAIAAELTPENGVPFSVNTLSFSENGYHLLGPSSTSTVAVWDLRKQKAATDISLGDSFKINQVEYDYSAGFLGVAGNEGVRIFANKKWDEVVRFEEAGDVTSFAFGALGQEIWGTSGREVRIWGSA